MTLTCLRIHTAPRRGCSRPGPTPRRELSMPPQPTPDGVLIDACGRRRSPATMPEFRKGKKPANAGKRYPQEVLSDEQVLTLIDGQSRTSATGLRNRALIAFMWRSGARVGCEALRLEVGDLNWGACTVHIRKGKNSKARIVAMDPFGWDHLGPWLNARGKLDGVDPHSGLVFCTIARPVTGGPLASSSVRKMLKDTCEAAGITQRVTPHSLRHSLAAGLFDEGTDLRTISKMLGHSNLATTDIYVNHLPTKKLIAEITGRPVPGHQQAPVAPAITSMAPLELQEVAVELERLRSERRDTDRSGRMGAVAP